MPNPDAQRFEALIAPHLDVLFRAAFRLSRKKADAQDLVQETCVRAFVRIGELRDSQPVKAWLLRVLHNVFVDGVRRARLAPIPDVDDAMGSAVSPDLARSCCWREAPFKMPSPPQGSKRLNLFTSSAPSL